MGLVIVPHRPREPPRGPAQINRLDPLGKTLEAAWLGNDLSGKSIGQRLSGNLPAGTYIAATARGLALANAASVGASNIPISGANALPYVLAFYGWADGNFSLGITLGNSGGGNQARISNASATQWKLEVRHNFGTLQAVSITTGTGSNAGRLICAIAVVYSATDYRFFANGQMVNGTTNCGTPPSFNTLSPPCANNKGGHIFGGYGVGRSISDADALRITANPALLWDALTPADSASLWAPASADGNLALAGDAQAIASASGALLVDVPVTGAAIGVVSANGALSTAMPLSGVAAAVASASGVVTLGVALSGAALASATASGQMQVAIALSGAAIARAAASGALGVSSGSALSGAATANASASGALSVAVPLAGAAHVVASASGNLSVGAAAALAGAAVAVAAAGGALTVTVSLSGAAMAQAVAAGGMRLQVPLSGQAVMHAAAFGYLSGGQAALASDPRYTVARHALDASVSHRALHTTIGARQRNWTVHAH